MEIFTVIAFLVALVSDVVHGIRNGFDWFDVIVICLVAAALAVNIVALIRNRRK